MSISSIAVRPSRVATGADAPDRTRTGVPWKTVVVLATVMAYADGFWVTSLRGAVGAIERTQSPFASWWQEATVMLPVYLLAVLGALTLARRWFGPVLHRPRTLLVTALMVVVAGTLAGVAETVVSAAYDYRLQTHQMLMMDSMRSLCDSSCFVQEKHNTLVVHIRGISHISRWLLLTNLVAVGWIVAMFGGRLELARARVARVASGSRAADVRLLLAGSLVAAAAVHAAVVPAHLTEWPTAGMFFILLTIWELAVAGLLLARIEERMMLLAAAVVSVGPLAVWLLSRTAGLPFGPEPGVAETIGLPDIAACLLEVLSLVTALVLLRRGADNQRPVSSAHARSLVALALVAVAVIGITGVGLHWFDPFGLGNVRHTMDMTAHIGQIPR
jgi:hypothetical protein